MSYGQNDPRRRLSGPTTTPLAPSAPAQYLDLTDLEPDDVSAAGSRTWWVRGQNFALAYTAARSGDRFARSDQPDEYVVLFPRIMTGAATVCAGQDEVRVDDAALVVVPPGESAVQVTADVHLVRLFSAASPDLLARCRNGGSYSVAHANVATFTPWPDPPEGHRVRSYRLADHPYREGRFGRLFRCSTFMVNVFDPYHGPRDTARLSPHHHEDFEQCSLAVDGQWVHHVRYPWTNDLAEWREDEHVAVASPSVAIIPPPSTHTSQAVGRERNQLIDIFCPPRRDFSAMEGWVINENDYPVPPP